MLFCAKMSVCGDGSSYRTVVGGSCGEKQIQNAAIQYLLERKETEISEIDLIDEFGVKSGDLCRSNMLAFIEPFLYKTSYSVSNVSPG
jgi:xanthine/CO dehydrogenase XdhC/CoxF family maturation factor